MTDPEAGILTVLRARASDRGDQVAMRYKARGLWRDVSWSALEHETAEIALGLESRGVSRGEPVVVVSDPSPTWVAALLAVHAVGALPVSLYQSLGIREVADVLDALDARMLIVDAIDWVNVMVEREVALPEEIVVMDGETRAARGQRPAVPLAEVRAGGRAILDADADRWEELVEAVDPERACLLLSTAASSGPPKLVAHTSRSLLASAGSLIAEGRRKPVGPSDSIVVELPAGHLGAFVVGIVVPLLSGAVSHLPEQLVADALAEVRPTVSLASGHQWEREAALVTVTARSTRGLRGRAFALAEKVAQRRSRVLGAFAYGFVLLPLLRKLGVDRIRRAYVLGPVAPETIQAWRKWRVELTEIYWSTEAGILVARRDGGVLHAATGVELSTDDGGRVVVTSEACAVGLWGAATVERAPAEGRWTTDDVALEQDDGQLELLGREADLIAASGGPISLAAVESTLRGSPYFRGAIVTADRQHELVALVDLDIEAVSRWASTAGVAYRSPSALRDSEEVRQLIREAIAATNERLTERGLPQIAAAVPSSERFAVGREVGPTWSPRRRSTPARRLAEPEEDLSRAS